MAEGQSTTFSWREEVEKIDGPNRHLESLYPVVYDFGEGVRKRDSGPKKGPYEPPAE